jgi:hypothetical protein
MAEGCPGRAIVPEERGTSFPAAPTVLKAERLEALLLVTYTQVVFELLAVMPPENGCAAVEPVAPMAVRLPVAGL